MRVRPRGHWKEGREKGTHRCNGTLQRGGGGGGGLHEVSGRGVNEWASSH